MTGVFGRAANMSLVVGVSGRCQRGDPSPAVPLDGLSMARPSRWSTIWPRRTFTHPLRPHRGSSDFAVGRAIHLTRAFALYLFVRDGGECHGNSAQRLLAS